VHDVDGTGHQEVEWHRVRVAREVAKSKYVALIPAVQEKINDHIGRGGLHDGKIGMFKVVEDEMIR